MVTMQEPTPDDIQAVVEQIDSETPWTVEDWNLELGRHDDPELSVDLDWNYAEAGLDGDGVDRQRFIKEVIGGRDTDEPARDGGGVTVDDVLTVYLEEYPDSDREEFKTYLDRLRQMGEVYEPREGVLRTA